MTGVDGWKILKQKLSFKGLGCCGAAWSPTRTTPTTVPMEEEEPIIFGDQNSDVGEEEEVVAVVQQNRNSSSTAAPGMNLAMALAAERNLRVGPNKEEGNHQMKTLMRLIEETDGVDWRKNNGKQQRKDDQNEGDWMCCVCMERNKGAAFIPCGHAFCRVCSRELWLNRGSCPICNRSILEILDIF